MNSNFERENDRNNPDSQDEEPEIARGSCNRRFFENISERVQPDITEDAWQRRDNDDSYDSDSTNISEENSQYDTSPFGSDSEVEGDDQPAYDHFFDFDEHGLPEQGVVDTDYDRIYTFRRQSSMSLRERERQERISNSAPPLTEFFEELTCSSPKSKKTPGFKEEGKIKSTSEKKCVQNKILESADIKTSEHDDLRNDSKIDRRRIADVDIHKSDEPANKRMRPNVQTNVPSNLSATGPSSSIYKNDGMDFG
ncbi:Oidioi.mRNA.OKI2018_I69.chr1.g2692.t1.cds [Oikopleura dioica]|uniref:Oidioi.mRNA.OKI2018_I69.chr1.g2692.t1.cds n=1 Tax=Oikopleura dioica TaxID=34765 RepID=A0ABN7SW43_OIKDI|nr:Oidioi.mRNA.OKI2018_I69.chr1.g2692.t1.cds [Oikopleura dioica]